MDPPPPYTPLPVTTSQALSPPSLVNPPSDHDDTHHEKPPITYEAFGDEKSLSRQASADETPTQTSGESSATGASQMLFPAIPPPPEEPNPVDYTQLTDPVMRKVAEKEAERAWKRYEKALKDRAKLIRDREKALGKIEKRKGKEIEGGEKERRKELRGTEREREKEGREMEKEVRERRKERREAEKEREREEKEREREEKERRKTEKWKGKEEKDRMKERREVEKEKEKELRDIEKEERRRLRDLEGEKQRSQRDEERAEREKTRELKDWEMEKVQQARETETEAAVGLKQLGGREEGGKGCDSKEGQVGKSPSPQDLGSTASPSSSSLPRLNQAQPAPTLPRTATYPLGQDRKVALQGQTM